MNKIRVLLVDDQVLFAESLKRVIERLAKNVTVDGIALNGEEGIAAATRYRPDVVLMDMRLPTIDGVQATREILLRLPTTKVIMLTTYDDDEYVQAALQAGAVGYLLKDIPPEQLVSAIGAISDGAFLISPAIAERLVRQVLQQRQVQRVAPSGERDVPVWLAQLSRREKEILRFIAHGLSNREIAEALFIAEQTVKNHVSSIYSKIGENDRYRVIKKIKECLDMGYLT
jgi:DNA-binding NarL/FixJ family response regulator